MNTNAQASSFDEQQDSFDGSAEPTIYMSENRMPVMIEFSHTIIYIVFVALILALLLILPGMRRTKLASFIGLLSILTVGASILLSIHGSQWLTGSVNINQAAYSSLKGDLFSGRLDIDIGLKSANVSLYGKLIGSEIGDQSSENQIDYNERFSWNNPDEMSEEHLKALRKGLPHPILTVTEFLSRDSDGFNWGRQLRQAGYYTSIVLYLALISWLLTLAIICVLPVYLPQMMQLTGALLLSSVWTYTLLIQSPKNFTIQLAGQPIEFAFGFTYAICLVAGTWSMLSGLILMVIQLNNPNKQFTIMDSERYLNDQKAFYESNITLKQETLEKPKLQSPGSVIIPMRDIEENFKH